MSNERKNRIEAIYHLALDKTAKEDRSAYLDSVCQDDAELRAAVEGLLEAHDRAGDFLEAPLLASQPDLTESMLEVPMSEGPGSVIGRYKLLQKLGEGGFGIVYMAQQTQLVRRRVALKIIKLGMDTKQVVARFEAERQALALMDHANVAKVFDGGSTESGRPYFVMELVRGIPITQFCDENRLSTPERLELFMTVCLAVQHAHQKGIIHRDIKPSNILVTLHDGESVPKVIDFGIAKATQQELTEKTVFTQFQQMIGTPAYMSPEQAEMSGLDIDTRTDIYSLGVLLYELLTGSTPFDSKELMQSGLDEMRRIIREREPVKPSTRLKQSRSQTGGASRLVTNHSPLATELDWIAMRALEKDRRRRYDTAKGLANDVQRYLNQEPVEAGAPGVGYRCRKFIVRHRTTVALTGLVAVTLVLATVVSLWQATVATQARNETVLSLRQSRRIAYLADMSVVQASLDNHNIGRARRLLEEHRPRLGEEDLRDFEWFHFDRLARVDESRVLGTHPRGARSLLAGPDGTFLTAFRMIVFGEYSGPLQSWDGGSGAFETEPLALDGVTALALSRDGKRLALARGLDIEIRARDNPDRVEKTLTNWHRTTPFGEAIVTMCFCDDDTRLAVSSHGTARSSSASSVHGQPLILVEIDRDLALIPVVTSPLTQVLAWAVSEDGQRLALSDVGQEIVILRLPDAVEVQRFALPYAERVSRGLMPLTFVNQDRHLVTASDGGHIDLWEVADGRHVRKMGRHASSVTAFASSPDGRWLASAGLDQLVKLWDLEARGEPQGDVPYRTLRGHEDEVWGVAFLPDGQSLVTCGRDESVRLWNLQQDGSEITQWALPAGTLESQFGGGYLGLGSAERQWETWDISRLEEVGGPQPLVPPPALGDVVVIPLPDGTHWLALSNPIQEQRPGWGYPLTLYRGREAPEPVTAFSDFGFSGTGSLHCSGSRLFIHGVVRGEPHLLVWDLDSQRRVHLLRTFLRGDSSTMAVAPDERLVVLGDRDGALEVLNLATQTSKVHEPGRLSAILALAVLPGNQSAFAAGQPGIRCKLDLTTGAVRDWVPATLLGIEAMTLSPGATRLATGDAQGKVKLWDVETLREVAVLGTHSGRVRGVQFRPDGRSLLSVDNSELRIWRTRRD